MVTNERQRLYACEARAAKIQQKKNQGLQNDFSQGSPTPTDGGCPGTNGDRRSHEPSHEPSQDPVQPIDPKLGQDPYNVDAFAVSQDPSTTQNDTNNVGLAEDEIKAGAEDGKPRCIINIMQDRRRLKPAATLATCPDFSSLVEHTKSMISDDHLKFSSIGVLGPGIWLDVGNEDEWKHAITVVMENEFMDGVVKCVVQVEEQEL